MKKQPRKTKQWAAEAFESLEKAKLMFFEEYPTHNEEEKIGFIRYAVNFAAMNRWHYR